MSIDKIKPGDELTQSQNLIQTNIAKLKELFPEAMAEGKIDFNVLQELLGNEIEQGDEYYRFTWAGKAQARREAHKPSTGTLRPAKDESVDWENTQNLYIEGDNLEVLKLLQKSYAGKIKMIYIDPPYNTGKDFVYKDNYKDNLKNYQEITGQIDSEGNRLTTNSESDGRYHSNWLNMMYPRLQLARNLLKDGGIILVHIDEHEYSNLEKVLTEVFGENNNLGTIVWDKRNPKGEVVGIAQQHELISIFAKNKLAFKDIEQLRRPKENAHKIIDKANRLISDFGGVNDELKKVFKKWLSEQNFSGGEKAYNLIDDKGDVYQSVSMAAPDKPETRSHRPLIHPVTGNDCPVPAKGWRFPDATMDDLLRKNEIVFGEDEFSQPRRKYLLKENLEENVPSLLYFGGSDDALGLPFDNPKPLAVAKKLIRPICRDGEISLDFYSGSATSAHAIMELNIEDNGNRKFIQVQLPQPVDKKEQAYKDGFRNIADIGKERIRRAAKKIAAENPEKAKELDLGFKVFKLDTSNIKAWDGSTENLEQTLFDAQDNIKPERTEEDVLYEILLKYGLDLTLPIEEKTIAGKKVFSVGYGALFLCLANGVTRDVAEGIGKWKEELQPETCRVIFKDSGFGTEKTADVEKTNALQTLKRFGIDEVKSI